MKWGRRDTLHLIFACASSLCSISHFSSRIQVTSDILLFIFGVSFVPCQIQNRPSFPRLDEKVQHVQWNVMHWTGYVWMISINFGRLDKCTAQPCYLKKRKRKKKQFQWWPRLWKCVCLNDTYSLNRVGRPKTLDAFWFPESVFGMLLTWLISISVSYRAV